MSIKSSLKFLASASLISAAFTSPCSATIEKDVVIVGGGASGCYAAFRLREDYDQSILLVESQSILGGHVDTYTAQSGKNYDYGVQSFLDVNGASTFVSERLGVPLATPGHTATTADYFDFDTGESVDFTGPTSAELIAALTTYAELCEQWESKLLPSYWDFWAPEDIPEDLLLTFGEFATKYSIEAVVPTLFKTTGMGVGDVSNVLTLWVMQAFGGPMARSFLGTQSSFVPASGRNQDVYDAFADKLGSDVYYSSTVVSSERTDTGVTLKIQNGSKGIVTVKAKRLLLAIQPTQSNLAPFDLDSQESAVFDQFTFSSLHAAIVSNPSLPTGYSLTNTPTSAAPSNWLVFPELSFTARFDWMGTEAKEGRDYFRLLVIGKDGLTADQAKALAQTNFNTLVQSGAVTTPQSTDLEIVAYSMHGPMHSRVTADDLRAGFIQDLYALQGLRSTWWTGGAWVAQFQTHLWWYDDILIPKLLADL